MRRIAALIAATMILQPAFAAEEKHDHKVSFDTVTAGLKAIDEYIVEIKDNIAAGDFEALHHVAEELHGASEGLGARLVEVAAANKERFKFNADQIRLLGDQLEAAHGAKDKAAIERVVKRLEGVRDRMIALAPAGS